MILGAAASEKVKLKKACTLKNSTYQMKFKTF